jgi:hypothetical protein
MSVPDIYYDPDKAQGTFDVPAGTYTARFDGLVEKEPFKEGTSAGLPRVGWRFTVLDGPCAGKIIEQATSATGGPGSKLAYLLKLMMEGLPLKGRVSWEGLVGRTYTLTWKQNPHKMAKPGSMHIDFLRLAPANGVTPQAVPAKGAEASAPPPLKAQAQASPPPPPPPPPPPKAPAAPERFHVSWEAGQMTEALDREEVQNQINQRHADPATLLVCREGHEKWEPAKGCGFDPPPF